jgi:hypothetical protein
MGYLLLISAYRNHYPPLPTIAINLPSPYISTLALDTTGGIVTYKQDLDKIMEYAKDMGITIVVSDHDNPTVTANCDYWDKRITVYDKYITSTKSLIATLLHEICHIESYVRNKNAMLGYGDCNKRTYNIEKRDISKMWDLAVHIGLQRVTEGYIRAWMEFDMWQYWFLYVNGIEPNANTKRLKQVRLSRKYNLRYVIR